MKNVMKKARTISAVAFIFLLLGIASAFAFPGVYPTGATLYKPDKTWNGYTIFYGQGYGAVLIDMNGNVVHRWEKVNQHPVKMLPGGNIIAPTGKTGRVIGIPESCDLTQLDWNGKTVWEYKNSGVHHDFQREGNPVGYYAPGMDPQVTGGRTLILSHKLVKNPKITDKLLYEDYIFEVSPDGKITWDWLWHEHFDELEFSEEAKNALYRNPNVVSIDVEVKGERAADWLHINALSYVGPNKWYDAGDQRFHPDNVIWDARDANIIGITDRKTGKIVWKVGPDYTSTPALRSLGQIIGQHHAHMIPKGLPGAGNILVFDNGGWAGYGAPNPGSVTGLKNALRDGSRVVEFNPVTLEVVWEYSARKLKYRREYDHMFYSPFISSAQRLPNGNTLITEGSGGHLIEVTPQLETVWEYISPYFVPGGPGLKDWNMVYRSYRVPYDWVPQLPKPVERAITPPANSKIRVTPEGKLIVLD